MTDSRDHSNQLGDYVYGRSGDKGPDVTIGVIPNAPDDFSWIKRQVTSDRVKQHLGPLLDGEVERTELSELPGLVFLCRDALPGGGSGNLRTDAQGKTYFQALAKMDVDPDD